MTLIKAMRITMPKSGQVRDQTVNTFYFSNGAGTTDPTSIECQTIATELDLLYNTVVGAGSTVRSFLAESTMATQRVTYKMYNMANTKPRIPVAQPVAQNVTPAVTTQALPSEVAVCLSFRGALVSGTLPARRRGRVFIGPLNTSALFTEVATGEARVVDALANALVTGANRMKDNLVTAGIPWLVYSPTQDASTPGTGQTLIVHAWVDNAFDTQRRRGLRASSRITMDL